jgi:hypothetical protein
MRTLAVVSLLSASLFVFSQCDEENSNDLTGDHSPVLELTTEKKSDLNPGEISWYSFTAQKGEMYSITWFDRTVSESRPYIGDYTGSIYIGAYKPDKVSSYFDDTRLVPQMSTPRVIVAEETGEIYLKVYGFSSDTQGTFGIRVDKIDKGESNEDRCRVVRM